MTYPMDNFAPPQSQKAGRGLHTQESGDAGLSSNMEHKFNDFPKKSALPVAEKGSSVTPIPKENPDILDSPASSAKLVHAAVPKACHVSDEWQFIRQSTAVQTSPPQYQTDIRQMSETPEEETFKFLPPSPAITDEQSHVGDKSCTKMDTAPKCPPLAPGGRRISNQLRKRAAGKYRKVYLLCWMAFVLPVSAGGDLPAAEQKYACFTCKDKDKCQKLMKIIDAVEDDLLHQRNPEETIPDCSVIFPADQNCSVCLNQSKIVVIFCLKDFRKIDVEDSDGQVDVIPTNCVQQQNNINPPRTRYGLIASGVFFLMVVGAKGVALVINRRCHPTRTEH